MVSSEVLLSLPGYQITGIEGRGGEVRISARYSGPIACPACGGKRLRSKGRYRRRVRHEDWGVRHGVLEIEAHKYLCRDCGRQFRQQFPGILRYQRASEAFRESIFVKHWDGINRSRLGKREGIGSATVERWFQHFLRRQAAEYSGAACSQVLGIDEHFFSRRHGYATTFCDLKNHKVYDVVLGRSQLSLEGYLQRLAGKERVRVVCMDLAPVYRAIVQRHFPQARIVADRFHVIRLVNHYFLACWRELDPLGSKNRGPVSLVRRHWQNLRFEQQHRLTAYLSARPAIQVVYRFKQRLCWLLLKKHRTRKQCQALIPRFLRTVYQLRQAGLAQLTQLGQTLHAWSQEIVAMWRFTRNNGITEGFHTKMELLQRQAFGFRNFENYRLRVKVMCS